MSTQSDNPDRARRGAVRVTRALREAGYEAWLVGGCVRDRLLERPVREYDIATDATPDEVRGLFRRTVAVGAQFGVLVVLVPEGEYEVATFRAEGGYSDGRRPDQVRFTNAREDVLRRDFTINGLLEDPETGEICDFVNGRRDLAARVIRAIGDPRERFAEDHLRVLRAVRFAAVLGFDIEPATFNAILEMAPMVANVSVERILSELRRSFTEGDAGRAYTLLALSGVLDAVLPEADWLGSNVAARVQTIGPAPFAVYLASLLGDVPPAQGVEVAQRLKTPKADRELVVYLLEGRRRFQTRMTRAGQIRFVRDDRWPLLARMVRAERVSLGQDADAVDALEGLRQSLTPEELSPARLLDGNDLKGMGLAPGPHFKRLLDDLEDEQLEGRITTREQAEAFVRSRA